MANMAENIKNPLVNPTARQRGGTRKTRGERAQGGARRSGAHVMIDAPLRPCQRSPESPFSAGPQEADLSFLLDSLLDIYGSDLFPVICFDKETD
jgi:hypothetical protein